MFTHVPS